MEQKSSKDVVTKFIEELVMMLVDQPEEVSVVSAMQGDVVAINVTVEPGDLGYVIGKQGRTARSIRTLLGAASVRLGVRCELNIQEYAEVSA